MQLQYPLMFPWGDDGFCPEIPLRTKQSNQRSKVDVNLDQSEESKQRTCVSLREYYAYKLMIRPNEGLTPHLSGRLWQQYIVDAYTAVEQYRLDWVKGHQNTIRADLYNSIRDSLRKGDTNPSHIGKKIILPATFTGSRRYMSQYFKDSLAICRSIGHPSFFLTMTCNTKWPEIQQMLDYLPGVSVHDAPDVVSRVFKMKLDQLVDLIKNKNYFGRCIGIMYVIEFQKRGLPHTHMLVWLHPDDRPKNIEKIDELVSAEIPDKDLDPIGYNAVKNYMIHGPCGKDYSYSPCMVNGKCMRHYPKRFPMMLKSSYEYENVDPKFIFRLSKFIHHRNWYNFILYICIASVQINSIPSTKIYLNLEDEVVTAMRSRLEDEGYKGPQDSTEIPIPSQIVNVIETITLKELAVKTNTDDIKRKFLCCIKITKVEQADNWWYLACSNSDCQGEVYKIDGKCKCSKCKKAIPVGQKIYKIVVLAADSTEAFNFVLSDRAARRLLGQYATTMIATNTHLEQSGAYPTKIEKLAGKECTFTIEISEENVLVQSKIFNVIDAYECDSSTSSPPSGSMPEFSVSSFAENMIDLSDCGETPGSLKSCTKKPKLEK